VLSQNDFDIKKVNNKRVELLFPFENHRSILGWAQHWPIAVLIPTNGPKPTNNDSI